jgi:predicted NAD-dependent protein-ADP-ribosyltransferase YbiA (DUF1768 family)
MRKAETKHLKNCGALFALFSNLPTKSLLPERLKLFDQVRRKRANRQQIVSSVPAEETKNLGEKLKEYESEGPPNVARSEDMRESILRELGYVAHRELKSHLLTCVDMTYLEDAARLWDWQSSIQGGYRMKFALNKTR